MLSYLELKGINNEKTLEEVREKYNLNQKFVIEEKIHGANVSFRFEEGKPMAIHSRNQVIGEHDKFFGIQAVMPLYKPVEEKVLKYMQQNADKVKSLYLFGEYFGGAIQQGIDYGQEKRILFFDIYINENIVDYVTFEQLQKEIGIEEFCVKPLTFVNSFDEAISYNIKFNSTHSNKTDSNICEGIVIKQYCLNEGAGAGEVFICKLKNTHFLECTPKPKEKKEKAEKKMQLMDYINPNRIESYLSKNWQC